VALETEAVDEADDGYDPTEFAEEDDEFCGHEGRRRGLVHDDWL
jgi:hypothetical protein